MSHTHCTWAGAIVKDIAGVGFRHSVVGAERVKASDLHSLSPPKFLQIITLFAPMVGASANLELHRVNLSELVRRSFSFLVSMFSIRSPPAPTMILHPMAVKHARCLQDNSKLLWIAFPERSGPVM